MSSKKTIDRVTKKITGKYKVHGYCYINNKIIETYPNEIDHIEHIFGNFYKMQCNAKNFSETEYVVLTNLRPITLLSITHKRSDNQYPQFQQIIFKNNTFTKTVLNLDKNNICQVYGKKYI